MNLIKHILFLVLLLNASGCGKFGFLDFSKKDRSLRNAANLPEQIDVIGRRSFVVGACADFNLNIYKKDSSPMIAPIDYVFSVQVKGADGALESEFYSDSSCRNLVSSLELLAGTSSRKFYIRHRIAETASLRIDMEGVNVGEWPINVLASNANRITFSGPLSIEAGVCSEYLVRIQDSLGNASDLKSARVVSFEASHFYRDSACSNSSRISSLTISQGSSSAPIYVKVRASGGHFLEAESSGFEPVPYGITVLPGPPTQLSIEGEDFIPARLCSGAFSAKRLDAFGNASAIPVSSLISISGFAEGQTSSATKYYTDPECRNETTELSIESGNEAVLFYLRSQGTETHNLNVASADYASASQVIRILGAGALDPSFKDDGRSVVELGQGTHSQGRTLSVLGDGKILVGGIRRDGANTDAIVVRLDSGGNLDTTFSGGVVTIDFGSPVDVVGSIGVQDDGKVVVVGSSGLGSNKFAVAARLSPSGVPDTSFGTAGIAKIQFQNNVESGAMDFVFVPGGADQHIVLVGYARSGSSNFALAKLNQTGNLVNTFGASGRRVQSISSSDDVASSVALDSVGRFVLAGYAKAFSNSSGAMTKRMAVVRFDSSGFLDSTFASGGRLIDFGQNHNSDANDLVIQPDGKIIVAGNMRSQVFDHFAMVRLTTAGNLDPSFGVGGATVASFGASQNSTALSLVRSGEDSLLLAGHAYRGNTLNDMAVVRTSSLGVPDTTFGSTGRVASDFNTRSDEAFDIAIYQGTLIVAGFSTSSDGVQNLSVLRLLQSEPDN